MKNIIIILSILFITINLWSQDQTVNGDLTVNTTLTLGKRVGLEPGSIDRLIFVPYYHTGGPWKITSRDTPNEAFLDFHYGIYKYLFTIQHGGNIGIGVAIPKERLEVNGTIRSKEVKIEATGWADFVFDKNYKLPTLQTVEQYIKDKGHLPDIPSEKEVLENGISLGDMQTKLIQKIEELTLYVIELEKKVKQLEKNQNND